MADGRVIKHRRSEDAIQRAIVLHIKLRGAKDMYWCAIPNGGWRSKTEAAIMNGLGVRAGAPDMIFIHDGKAFGLEIKADGRPSIHQLAAQAEINAAGGFSAICYGLDACLRTMEAWGLLKGKVSA